MVEGRGKLSVELVKGNIFFYVERDQVMNGETLLKAASDDGGGDVGDDL